MTAEPTIDYEGLAQEAMRGVVRTVLVRTVKNGLAGDHHFYISFDTEAPGVSLSRRLKEKYPREMTIVLQHRFWDLAVTDDRFEVKLTFDGIPERLVVPFAAIKVFFDPSVRFGLQFEDPNAPADGRAAATFDGMTPRNGAARPVPARKSSRTSRKPRAADESGEAALPPGVASLPASAPAPVPAKPVTPLHARPEAGSAASTTRSPTEGQIGNGAEEAREGEPESEAAKPATGAEIVSLDKFRKK